MTSVLDEGSQTEKNDELGLVLLGSTFDRSIAAALAAISSRAPRLRFDVVPFDRKIRTNERR